MDIEKKIRKLLALSESPNEFEAQAALLKARKLMAEYKLTEAELHEVKNKGKTIKTSISAQNEQIFGYSLYLPLLAKITVARLYMKEQNTQKHILLDSLDSKKM